MSSQLRLVTDGEAGPAPAPPSWDSIEPSFRAQASDAMDASDAAMTRVTAEMDAGTLSVRSLQDALLAFALAAKRFREWVRIYTAREHAAGRWVAPAPGPASDHSGDAV